MDRAARGGLSLQWFTPSSPPPLRWTALHAAASFGHAGVVVALLAGRADPGRRNTKGEAALDVAAQKQNHAVASLLTMARDAGKGGPPGGSGKWSV